MSNLHSEMMIAVLAPIATGLVAAATGWAKERHDRRNLDLVRRRALDDAIVQITVVESWAKALTEVSGLSDTHANWRSRAVGTLDEAFVRAAQELHRQPLVHKSLLNSRTVFLLPLTSPAAKAVRVLYYLCTIFLVGISAIVFDAAENVSDFATLAVTLSFLAVPSIALHALTNSLEKRFHCKLRRTQQEGQHPRASANTTYQRQPWSYAGSPSPTAWPGPQVQFPGPPGARPPDPRFRG